MSVLPLYEAGQPFYVPAFEVRFVAARAGDAQGTQLPANLVRDVIEVTYHDSLDKVDSFTLVLNNWDADKRQPLFLGAEKGDPELFKYVEPGVKVQLLMGYQGRQPDLRVMTTGFVTTLEADFPEAGAPRLTVRGLNVLDRFRRKQYTWAWPADGKRSVTDSEIALELASPPDAPPGKPGLDIEVRVNPGEEPERTYVMMNNQYPIVFLMQRARRNGYDLFLGLDTSDPRRPREFLYFGPSKRVTDRTYKLEWGKSLVSFKPTLSTARQVKKVTVLGWDRKAKKQIKAEATLTQDAPTINPDLHPYIEAIGREEVVADEPVSTEAEAKKTAVRYLEQQVLEMVEATGVVVGLPDLRAGRVVEIGGFDSRLNGRWFLKETTHTINDNGYRTTFVARREGPKAA